VIGAEPPQLRYLAGGVDPRSSRMAKLRFVLKQQRGHSRFALKVKPRFSPLSIEHGGAMEMEGRDGPVSQPPNGTGTMGHSYCTVLAMWSMPCDLIPMCDTFDIV
jgi:hypothetical protein